MASRLVAVGPASLAALRDEVAAARRTDPLTPLTVVAPGHVPVLSVRRALARDPGVANVSVVTLRRLAEQCGQARLAGTGLGPLRSAPVDEAVRLALAADPGPFASVADHPRTVARVGQALRSLRALSDGDADEATRRSPHLLRLRRAVEALAPGWDERALFEAAAAAVSEDPGGTPVIAFLLRPATPAAASFLRALSDDGRLLALLGVTGEDEVDAPVLALHRDLGGVGERPMGTPPRPTAVVVAPDADAEARLAVQRVVEHVQSGRRGPRPALHRIAIVPGPGASRQRVLDHLEAAGVGVSAPSPTTLAASVTGRTLLGLLALEDEGFSRAGVMRVLAGGPVRLLAGRPGSVPAARWGELARAANVVAGADQWIARLTIQADTLAGRRRPDRAAEVRELVSFVEELRDRVDPGSRATWADFAAWAVAVLDRYVGTPEEGADAGWPDPEIAAHKEVRRVVRELAALDAIGAGRRTAVSASTFVTALAKALDRPGPRRGRVGDGVLVVEPADLAGAELDLVLVLGLTEGAVPSRAGNDPLLPGVDRRAQARAEERAALLTAMAAAPEVVAMTARADHQAERRPSRWLLEWAGALAERPAADPVRTGDLSRERPDWPWLTVVPSFERTVCRSDPAAAQERDLAALRSWADAGLPVADHPLVARTPALGRGLAAGAARASAEFTAYDGRVRRPPPLPAAISPSALETWAECPQRYFLKFVLGVRETAIPEDLLALDGLSRGGLVHKVLEQLVRERGLGRDPDEPWSDDDRAWAAELASRLHDELVAEGRTSTSVLAEVRWDELLHRIDNALTVDDTRRAQDELVPADVEVEFGPGTDWGEVTVATPSGRTVGFKGWIDRVDVRADEAQVSVVDYKLGTQRKIVDAAAGGDPTRLLQLPVYALAAQKRWPAADVSAAYWLVDRDDRPFVENPLGDEQFASVVDAVVTGVEAGVFPAVPGEDQGLAWSNCRYCPYDRVCPSDRGPALARKSASLDLAPRRAFDDLVAPRAEA